MPSSRVHTAGETKNSVDFQGS